MAEKKTTTKKTKTADVTIKLTRSLVGCKKDQIDTAHSLKLKKVGAVTVQPDNAATKGKIKKIAHLITVIDNK